MPPKAKIKQSMSNISKTKGSTTKKKGGLMKKEHHKVSRQQSSVGERSFDGELQRKPSKAQISIQPPSAPRRTSTNNSQYSPSIASPPPPPAPVAPAVTPPTPVAPTPPPQPAAAPAVAPYPPQPPPPPPVAPQFQAPPPAVSPVQQAAAYPPAAPPVLPPPPQVAAPYPPPQVAPQVAPFSAPPPLPPPPRNDGSLYTNTGKLPVQPTTPGGFPAFPITPMEAVPISPVPPMAPTPPMNVAPPVAPAPPPAPPAPPVQITVPPPPPPPPPPALVPPPPPMVNPHNEKATTTPPEKKPSAGGAIHHFQNVLNPLRNMMQALQPVITHQTPAAKPPRGDGAGVEEATGGLGADDDAFQQTSNWVKKILETGIAGLKKEYWEVPNETPPEKSGTFKENPTKNRYWNIPCNDVTRFRLADSPTFYIHANYVGSGALNPRRFLCAQAPLVSTVEDFWRMVVASNTENIVMLCDLVEKGKPKSAEYFPQKVGDTMTIGNYCSVTKEHFQEIDKTVTMAKLKVTLTGGDGIPIHIKHLHWHQWPDHGAPDTVVTPFRVISHVRKSRRPILVHCSAGVGRTGTLVLIAIILESIRSADFPGVKGLLTRMREERFKLVQTEIQYLYVHRCTLEYFIMKNLCTNYSKDAMKKFRDEYDVAAEKCVV